MSEYTQGITCYGAVILKNGLPMTPEQIIEELSIIKEKAHEIFMKRDSHPSEKKRMLTQELVGVRNGKTQLLLNIAKGASQSRKAVLFVVPSGHMAHIYRTQYQLSQYEFVEIIPYIALKVREVLIRKQYDYVLMDDVQDFCQSEGDPVKVVDHSFRWLDRKPLVVAARTELDHEEKGGEQ